MSRTFFITGTSTEVGKTFVTCALLDAFEKLGKRTSAMKPIASGCEWENGELKNSDALNLQSYATEKLAYNIVNPYAFEPAIAPHIAAKQAGVEICLKDLLKHTHVFLQQDAEIKLIEGAGGWLVPLNEQEDFSDYVKALDIHVILVVSIGLGCINHALLSAEAIRAKGLTLAGWVANISANASANPNQENIECIAQRIHAPLLSTLPYFRGESQKQNIQSASAILLESHFQNHLSFEKV